MSARSMNGDRDGVTRCEGGPGHTHNRSGFSRNNVLAQAEVRARNLIGQAIADHGARPSGDFFGRLEQGVEGS